MNKRLFAVTLAALTAVSMCACGGNASSSESSVTLSSVSDTSSVSKTSSASETSSVSESTEKSETSTTSSSSANYTDEVSYDSYGIEVVDEDCDALDCVEPGEYKNLTVTDTYADPTDEDVESYINSALTAVTVEDKNATAEEGDTVDVDYIGPNVDGMDEVTESVNQPSLVLGSGSFISDFEDAVVGMKVGESKDVTVTFPDDYWSEDYAGKEAKFNITLNEIKRAPELTDEWVANESDSDCKTVDEYKKYVYNLLVEQNKENADSDMQYEAWEQVFDSSEFKKIPKSELTRGEEAYDSTIYQYAQMYGFELEDYLVYCGVDAATYLDNKGSYAMQSAKSTILVHAIWELEGMTEDDEAYQKILSDLMEEYDMTKGELTEAYTEEILTNYCKSYAVLEKILSYSNIVKA